jgi:non-ribosomal peptide synthetase component E (peptide arylation enzyme)
LGAIAYHLSKELVLGKVLARHPRNIPNQEALIAEGNRFGCREFNDRVNDQAQSMLAPGIRGGDKMAYGVLNRSENMQCY